MPDIKEALRDFVATSNSGKYTDEKTLLSKFPELKGYDVNALRDFVATSNSGKYKSEDELFSKFPEFNPAPPTQTEPTTQPRNKVAEMLNQPTSQDIQREKRGISTPSDALISPTKTGGTKTPQMGVPIETAKKEVEKEVKAKENLSQEVAFMDVQKDAEVENLSTEQLFDKNAPDLLKYLPKDKVVEYELIAKEKKLTADKQMLIERMKATNNPNTLNELNKTKVEEFKTKVEREKLQEARKKGFDAEIAKLNALATQMDQEGKTSEAEGLRKSIVAAEGERDGYFKDPDAQIMKIYSANKVDMDEFQVPGNTPMERTKNYALILQKQIADLDKKMQGDGPQKDGSMLEGISKVFDDQYQFYSGKKAKLEAKLAQVAPIALLNQLPTRGTDGFFNTMTNRIAKELLPEQVMARPENLTFEDIGGIIRNNQVSMALSDDLITKGAIGAVDLMTEETKSFSPKWWGDITGSSLALMPAFIFGNKAAGAMKVPVLFEKIAVALKAQKYGKYISPFVLPAEKGIEYAAAKPFLSDELGEEASFLSGYLGQAISGPVGKGLSSAPMQAMFNKLFGKSAPIVYNQIKALGGRVSSGLGEYGEEVGNTLGPILETYMNEQDFGKLKKELAENFGKLEPNLELFVGSVVMGMAMGSGTGIGDASLNKSKEVYATLTPAQQKTADEILKQFKDDLETSEVNAKRQEIAEGDAPPKVEEVTEVDLQNKQAAIEVIQSPTASIKEKAEAAKIVRDIEAKEREVVITEKALEQGPLAEGEVVKEEVVETPKEEVVKETPMAEETKVGELVVTDEVKDIKDEVTDEKIGEKKYQSFSIDFEDGARAIGTIENGVASISGINAPKAEGSVIEPKRGTKTYERVISKLKESGVKTISVKLQSTDSEKAIDKLVEKGILTNPRDIRGGSFNQRPTTFDISTTEPITPQEVTPTTPILKEEGKIEGTPQEVQVIDEESYLAQNGAPFMGGAEPALQKNIKDDRNKAIMVNKVQEDMAKNNARREELRKEYAEKVAKGEIRTPTREEKLIETANGNEDLESTQAARRLLDKRGVAWKQPTPPSQNKVETPKKEGLKEQKPKTEPKPKTEKPKTFVSKSGKQVVGIDANGEMEVYDKATGKVASAPTRRKVLKEYIESTDFNKGERSVDPPEEFREKGYSDETIETFVVENSSNPLEVVEVFLRQEPIARKQLSAFAGGSKTDIIANAVDFPKIKRSGFIRFGDRNLINASMAKSYFSNNGIPIDVVAQSISEETGVEVTTDDLVEFIVNYPNGQETALRMGDNKAAKAARERFKELTGLNLTDDLAEQIIDQQDKISEKQIQEFIQNEYKELDQLRDEYWATYEDVDSTPKKGGAIKADKPITSAEGEGVSGVESETEKLVSKLRNLKIDTKGKTFDATLGLPVAVYNSAIEIVAKAIEGGAKLGNAIAKAMKYIDSQMGDKQWNKGFFAKEMNVRYSVTLPNGSNVEVERDTTKETAEVIKGWYQPIEQKIIDTKQDSLPANKWAEILKSKEDEDLWTGVREFLKDKGKETVTKKELSDFIKENRVEIVEVVKGADKEGIAKQRESAKKRLQELGVENVTEDDIDNYLIGKKEPDNTKFSQYQLEGEKENYKEVLVTLPSQQTTEQRQKRIDSIDKRREDLQNEIDALYKQRKDETKEYKDLVNENEQLLQERQKIIYNREDNTFRSSHFDEPNIVVHLRMNTRTDAEGNKVLFLEEVQGDFPQAYRKDSIAFENQIQKDYNKVLNTLISQGIIKRDC